MLSPDGHCRAFDHRSQGTVFGSGAGVVALRRLEDALADGDQIYAVIKGTAVNNDGAQKVGYLAPSVDGQAACIAEALAVADVDAETHQLRRVPRHRHADGRPDRDRRAHPGVPRRHRQDRLLPHRQRQDQHRPPRHRGRRRQPDQGGAGAAPRRDPAEPQLRARPTRTSTSSAARSSSTTELRDVAPATARPAGPGSTRSASAAPTPSPSLEEAPDRRRPHRPSDVATCSSCRRATSGRSTTTRPSLADHLRRQPRARPRRRGLDPAGRAAPLHRATGARRARPATRPSRSSRRPTRAASSRTRAGHCDRDDRVHVPRWRHAVPADGGRSLRHEPVFAEHLDDGLRLLEDRHGLDLRPLLFCDEADGRDGRRGARAAEPTSCPPSSSSSTRSPSCCSAGASSRRPWSATASARTPRPASRAPCPSPTASASSCCAAQLDRPGRRRHRRRCRCRADELAPAARRARTSTSPS